MAVTLGTSVKLIDNMSGSFTRIINAVNLTVSALRKMSNESVKISGLEDIQSELNMAGAEMSKFKDALAKAGNGTDNNTNAQRKWNNEINKGKSALDSMVGKLKAAFGVYALMNAGKKLIGLSDQVVSIDARLNLITDNAEQKNNLKNAIYKSAQDARVQLNDFANSVAKIGQLAGQHFANNGEIIKFNNLMAKSFKISGASARETSAAMYQLNQAMASGRLQGDEFRSIRENAPMLVQEIAKAMGVGMEQLKKLGAEGKITAEVIKQAVFGMESDINEKFAQIPLTWKDVWTQMSNIAIKALEPLLKAINDLANSKRVQGFINGLVSAFRILGKVGTSVFKGLAKLGALVYDNWKLIEPVIFGIAAGVAFYAIVQGIAALATAASTAASVAHTLALGAQIMAEFAAIAATEGLAAAIGTLNAAVWAFPGTWIFAAIVGVTVAVIAAALATLKWATGTLTWAGVIVGAFYWVKGAIYNNIADVVNFIGKALAHIWNGFAATANFVGNVMKDPASAFIHYVKDMALQALDILKGFAGAVDDVIGTGFAKTVEGWKGTVQGVATELAGRYGNGQYEEVLGRKTAGDFGMDWKKKNLKFEYGAGAAKGNRWAYQMGRWRNEMENFNPFNLGGEKPRDPSGLGDIGKNTGKTADNTGKMANSLDDTEEEMKYLRELAEQEHINQFTTAEIKVDMNNTNTIEKEADLDSMIDKLAEKIEEKMNRLAEGVYPN